MATAAVSTEDVPAEEGGVRRYGATEGVPAVRAASCILQRRYTRASDRGVRASTHRGHRL